MTRPLDTTRTARRRFVFVVFSLLGVGGITWYLYAHSTLAERSPMERLREHVESDRTSIGRDLVDGYWTVDFHGPFATDTTVVDLMPYLEALPTGTPIDALDYDRSFAITISNAGISDEGIRRLADLPIAQLSIRDTPVTDALFQILSPQDVLHFVDLSGTRVTIPAAKRFQERHPRCEVLVDGRSVSKR